MDILKICSIFSISIFYNLNEQLFHLFGSNISKDPTFDFSRLWPLIVGLSTAERATKALLVEEDACKRRHFSSTMLFFFLFVDGLSFIQVDFKSGWISFELTER